MIDREEVLKKADELQVHTSYVQRDYIFGWILAGIYSASDLGRFLILKGGNCFRKAYFDSARYSPDLDFAATDRVTPAHVATELGRVCDFINQRTGVLFFPERTLVEPKTRVDGSLTVYEGRLYFRDFFGHESQITLSIRLDITEFGKIFLPIQVRNLVHPYSDQIACVSQLRCIKLEEMLASKLKCLLQRRHSADLYDFVYSTLVQPAIEVNRTEIVSTFLRMTIFGSGPGIVRELLFNLPFQTFRALWNQYLVQPITGALDVEHAIAHFRSVIEEMFGRLPRRGGEQAFFPWNLRNPILEAGHTMTLLRLTYDGATRLVEPYSLAYKTRKDGLSQEYFYAWDRIGGRTSGPGIKTFVHSKIQSLNNTDIKFEPRFEVELSRVGEYSHKMYFQGRHGFRRLQAFSEARFVYECPVCSKHFYRKQANPRLNPHKDQYGNQCFGRVGMIT